MSKRNDKQSAIQALLNNSHFRGVEKLYQLAKEQGIQATRKDIKEALNKQVVNQMLTNKTNKVDIPIATPADTWQMDLMFVDSKKPVMNLIECNTKVVRSYLLKNKQTQEIIRALDLFIDSLTNSPLMIISDNGKEFKNREVAGWMSRNKIVQSFRDAGDKNALAYVERFNRTLRGLLTNFRLKKKTIRITQPILDVLADEYNNTVSSSTGLVPNRVDNNAELELVGKKKTRMDEALSNIDSKYIIGSKVRLKLPAGKFDKEGVRWSAGTYTITGKSGFKFLITNDKTGKELVGRHSAGSLLPVEVGDEGDEGDEGDVGAVVARLDRKKKNQRQERRLNVEGVEERNVVRGGRRSSRQK